MNLNKLLTILIIVAVVVLLFRFGIGVVRIAFRLWYITIPLLLLLYWRPKKKGDNVNLYEDSLDPSKEIKPPKEPIIKDVDEAEEE